MPFYEVVFETGSNSVAEYESDEEALSANEAQNTRAKSGLPGGPTGHSAERVKAILKYDKHPADFGADQAFSADVATKTIADLIKQYSDENGVVSKTELASAILRTSDAVMQLDERKPGESIYKMKEKSSLDLPWGEQ